MPRHLGWETLTLWSQTKCILYAEQDASEPPLEPLHVQVNSVVEPDTVLAVPEEQRFVLGVAFLLNSPPFAEPQVPSTPQLSVLQL